MTKSEAALTAVRGVFPLAKIAPESDDSVGRALKEIGGAKTRDASKIITILDRHGIWIRPSDGFMSTKEKQDAVLEEAEK